jgi:hypothetical protein
MNAVKVKKVLDKEAVWMTLGMCRSDSEMEALLEAVPGYLQIDGDADTCINDIGSLLNPKGSGLHLGHRMIHLFSSCINGDGKMDEVARRHRAVTCSHVVFKLSKLISSVPVKSSTLDRHNLQHLSRDHDPKIAFAALRTIAVLERALLDQLLDADGNHGMDSHMSKVAEVLPQPSGRMMPLPRATKLGRAIER